MSATRFLLAALVLVAALARSAGAVDTDGSLDPAYGAALSTQTNGFSGTAVAYPTAPYRDHTQLDVLHAYVSGDAMLHVFVGGVLMDWIGNIEPSPNYDDLYLYVDDVSGGQATLISPGAATTGFPTQAGLRFGAGFVPDFVLQAHAPKLFGSGAASFFVEGWEYTLTDQASTGAYLGAGSGAAPGTLSNGVNPQDIRLAIDNSATGGVPGSCVPGSGAGVTSGVEWSIPLAAIGSPGGCFKILVYASSFYGTMRNQSLPPMTGAPCQPGYAGNFDFSAYGGESSVTVCPASVPVRAGTWGSLKAAYR